MTESSAASIRTTLYDCNGC